MYADRYGGDGVRPGLGAGRAGFLPYGNLYVKGVGLTPLFKDGDPDDFEHSHGAVHFDDCMLEALFGEVNENLFSRGSARIVAIIDQGRNVIAPCGQRIPVALVVRAGVQLRPAHLLNRRLSRHGSRLETFIRIARATGQLVTRQDKATGHDVPNIKETMLRIIDDHARTAAEGFRWRIIHGALSSSNMEMSGAMLDLATESTQARTAPIWYLDREYFAFGEEHIERAVQLTPAYRALINNTPRSQRELFCVKWINIAREMDKAYSRHLQVQLLRAAGLKTELAQRLQTERSELAHRFTDLILQMIALKNPGSTRAPTSVVEDVSVLDVFNLLGNFPKKHFTCPGANHEEDILNYLQPVFRSNRFHNAKKKTAVTELVGKFSRLYGELMNACSETGRDYYCDRRQMQTSITARAAFENKPLDSLYAYRLLKDFKETIAIYRSTGDAALIRNAIDQRISASMRCVDALLVQGNSRRMTGGGIELGMRIIDGIHYSVKAWNDEKNTRRLHVSIPVARHGNHYTSSVPTLPRLTKQQVSSLRYRFTTDGWKNTEEAGASIRHDARDGLIIDFDDLCTFPLVGRLEGTLDLRGRDSIRSGDESRHSLSYSFAIPDRQELMKMFAAQGG